MEIQKIYIGGWFQRTTLHLTEIWDFFKYSRSNLEFSQEELDKSREKLLISSISRESGQLEYLSAKTDLNISYRIYEDGLIVLEKDFGSIKEDFKTIRDYYEGSLSESMTLIFSKGAPVPKELANIKTILPYIVTVRDAKKEEVEKFFGEFGEDIYSVLSTKNVEVYRSAGIILINNLQDEVLAREIIESQIFFREFKTQLHRYLDIHRTIWERIQAVKERRNIKGNEIDSLRNELSAYQKTVNLIGARINQMDSYAKTRQKIIEQEKIDDYLSPLFQFKFETLLDTHAYIKNLWAMTKDYLSDAISLFTELQAKSTKNTISSLQLVTTIGVVSGIFGYLGKDALPQLTPMGMIYFLLLMSVTWLVNTFVSKFYKNKKYPVQNKEVTKEIK